MGPATFKTMIQYQHYIRSCMVTVWYRNVGRWSHRWVPSQRENNAEHSVVFVVIMNKVMNCNDMKCLHMGYTARHLMVFTGTTYILTYLSHNRLGSIMITSSRDFNDYLSRHSGFYTTFNYNRDARWYDLISQKGNMTPVSFWIVFMIFLSH